MAEIAASLAGCADREAEYVRQTEVLLEEKYGEAFQVREYLGHDYTKDYYEATAYAQEYPQLPFKVKTACDGSYISDGYVAARVCEKIEQKMEINIAGVNGYYIIKAQPVSRAVDSVQADMDVNEFMELKSKNRFLIYLVYVSEDGLTDAFYEKLSGAFQELEVLSGKLELYVTDEETAKKVLEYFEEQPEIYSDIYEILDETEAKEIPFADGKLEFDQML